MNKYLPEYSTFDGVGLYLCPEDCECAQCYIKIEGQLLDETADSIEPLPTWKFHTTPRDNRRLLKTGVRLSDVTNHLTAHLPE